MQENTCLIMLRSVFFRTKFLAIVSSIFVNRCSASMVHIAAIRV